MPSSATDSSLRVGLAGVGRFGQLHAGVLADLPGVELAALADPDPQRLARVAERHGVTKRFSDALEMIADDSLDAVVLATPDEQHGPQARAALAQGHHLFVEKPLAATWQDARELQRLAAEAGVTLLGLAALDEQARPRYDTAMAAKVAAAGMPVAALSPLELARWVGEKLRGVS